MEELFGDFDHAGRINLENLKKILSDNRNTAYGKRYDFSHIFTEEEYREKLPLTDYTVYEGSVSEQGAFTSYPVRNILLTSGTTGVQKEFPLTEESLQRYSSYICEMPYVLRGGKSGPHLHTSVFRPPVKGRTLLSSAYYSYLAETGAFDSNYFVGGEASLFSDEIEDVPYLKACLALSCPELVSIQSIFLYDILLLLGYIEEHWEQLLDDLRADSCVDEAWFERLKAAFSEGFETPIVPRIWKNLRFVSGIGGPAYAFQEKALKQYIGELPIYYFAYASSECMAGVALEMDKAQYAFLPRSAYYEFLTSDGEIISENQLQTGFSYELVITTFSGLYRYRTGDFIKVLSFAGESPVFEVLGRKRISNIAGEKLDEATVRAAVRNWAEEAAYTVCDFSLGIDAGTIPNRYQLFVELSERMGDKWDIQEEEKRLDEILCGLSPDYEDVRGLGMLLPSRIQVLKQGELAGNLFGQNAAVHRKPQLFLNAVQTEVLLRGRVTNGK